MTNKTNGYVLTSFLLGMLVGVLAAIFLGEVADRWV